MRAFTGASAVGLVFSAAFGAMLLSNVLWCQDVWGWSALQTGLAIAPGPLMVPLFAFLVAGRLIARFGSGRGDRRRLDDLRRRDRLVGAGVGRDPDYVGDMLGGMLLTGVGVGLTLPTLMATAASSLPPQSFATGSAVVNMLRQVGLAIGVAVFVAVLGTPSTTAAAVSAFRDGWVVIAAVSAASAVVGLLVLPVRIRAAVPMTARSTSAPSSGA